MSDITDKERRLVRKWADEMSGHPILNENAKAAMRYVLATVDAPALSEELLEQASWAEEMGGPVHGAKFRALADRAEQMEYERNTLEQQRDYWRDSERQAVTERDEARAEMDHLRRDLAEAYRTRDARDDDVDRLRAEVERLTAQRDAMSAMVDSLNDDLTELRGPQPMPVHPSDQQSNSLEKPNSSFKSSLKEPAQNPADVNPGEAWIVECHREWRTAVKDRDDDEPWNTFTAGGLFFPEDNEAITLLHRLVPAPRVITNADELERLAVGSIIRTREDLAMQKKYDGRWYYPESKYGWRPSECADDLPVTVLWEPVA